MTPTTNQILWHGGQKEVKGLVLPLHFCAKHLCAMAEKDSQRVRSRAYTFTFNNPEAFRPQFDESKMKYMCYQLEQGENGTPHLQGYVNFKNPQAFSYLKKWMPQAHFEVAHGTPEQNQAYCSKEPRLEDFVEFGELPQQGKRTDLEVVVNAIKEKRPREEYMFTTAYVKYHRGLDHIRYLSSQPYTHDDVRGVWIYGPPGVGKSHMVRMENESLFLKQQNKWWDGYNGEEAVLIDDFDRNGVCLGHYLKIWADKWACTGEFKGGTCQLTHKKFYITSNYSINELFIDDSVLCEAIKRRFKIIHIPLKNF